jgi:CBS domain containing-hemolysin-like protein
MNRRQLNSMTRPTVPRLGRSVSRSAGGAVAALLCTLPLSAQASIFQGEALDKMADILTWVVLIVAPLVGIAVFWLVHILPEKIAEKRQHPQAKAIQCLCLLSLVFGGLLWPLAWLWAYSKPVLYQLAYGTDKVAHGHTEPDRSASTPSESKELQQLRQRVAELESRLAGKSAAAGGKA